MQPAYILASTKPIDAHKPLPTRARRFATTPDGLVLSLPPRHADVCAARAAAVIVITAERISMR
jgi:hypothetical protein